MSHAPAKKGRCDVSVYNARKQFGSGVPELTASVLLDVGAGRECRMSESGVCLAQGKP